MLQGLVSTANRLLSFFQRAPRPNSPELRESPPLPALPRSLERVQRVVLTEEVSRTLFDEYAAHRASQRGEEEIGWVLLGHRETDRAIVRATLPAGSQRHAGVAHIQFNEIAQAVACRMVRRLDKDICMVGVIHTHPGDLRQPSDGDFHGDSVWVTRLHGGEGIFGIGTADANGGTVKKHVQSRGELNLHWYALAENDRAYRPIEVQVTPGNDLALPLHKVWTTIECFAGPLERLCAQQNGVTFQVSGEENDQALLVRFKLVEEDTALRLVLRNDQAACYWQRGAEIRAVTLPCEQLDRAIYLVLADLTKQATMD